jgi:hypothetical protein
MEIAPRNSYRFEAAIASEDVGSAWAWNRSMVTPSTMQAYR